MRNITGGERMNLQGYRKKKKLTQDELAKEVGVSQAYISKIESDEFVNVTLIEIIKLSKALSINELEVAKYFLNKYNNYKYEFGGEIA